MGRKRTKLGALKTIPSRDSAKDRAGPGAGRWGSGTSRWRRPSWAAFLAAGIIALATAAAYSNSFAGAFVFDDDSSIANNPTIRQFWRIGKALCPPNHGETVSGRPLLNLSLAVNYAISSRNVWSYHALNLSIHILTALLLLSILRRTFLLPAMRARWQAVATPLALAIALLWAVHPLQTESVTYIVQRAESLMGLFYLLTLYCFLRGVDSARAGFWYAGSVAACLLGMATKEVMVSAPLIVLLYDRTFVAGSFHAAWRRRRGLYLALAATWALLGWMVVLTGTRGRTAGFGLTVGWRAYFCAQLAALVHYLRLCVWPHPLVLDYGPGAIRNVAEIVLCAAAIGLLGAATLVALWRWPKVGFLGAWFFAILAPTSSVVPVATQTIAEHRMYLSLAAVVTGVVLAGYSSRRWLVGRQRISPFGLRVVNTSLVTGAAVALGLVTFQRNAVYQSDLSIWQDTANGAPTNARAHNNLGALLASRGQVEAAIARCQKALEIQPDYPNAHGALGGILAACGQVDAAIAQYQEALRIDPAYLRGHIGLGIALARRGRVDAAIAHFRRALELDPDCAEAHCNLANALAAGGRFDDAISDYQKALENQPDYAEAHGNLGIILAARGQVDAAITHYQEALKIEPDSAEIHNNLGNLLAGRGQADAAVAHYQRALEIKPKFTDAHFNLGVLLAGRGQVDAAIAQYQAALAIRPNFAAAHCHWGIALAERGQWEAAIAHFERALAVKPDYAAVRRNRDNARRRLSEAKAPFREPSSAPSQTPARP